MAEHVQQQIIDWFEATLAGGSTAAGANVFTGRVDPLGEDELPGIVIEGEDETVEAETIGDIESRLFSVRVENTVRQATDFERAARALGLQTEKLIAAGVANAGGLCSGFVRCIGSQLVKSGEGNRAAASVVQTWQCSYHVQASAPDVAL